MMQYIPYLVDSGLEVKVMPFFGTWYLNEVYEGRRSLKTVLRAFTRRLRDSGATADLIWLEYEMLPWLPWLFERFTWPKKTPVITDYDDAIFHRYDQSGNAIVRGALGTKVDKVMKASDVVVAGNRYLAERAARAGARRIELVPTVVDAARYGARRGVRDDDRPRIGWIGTPETWRSCAQPFAELLRSVATHAGAVCRLVGAEPQPRVAEPFELLPWSEGTEVESIHGMDIGIMPLPDTPWTRGKCGYKLIQYMACGLPVVASPVGVNAEIVEHGVNGFLAESEDDWKTALEMLLRDPELRRSMGQAGRRKVEVAYSLEVHGPRVARLLKDVAAQGRR